LAFPAEHRSARRWRSSPRPDDRCRPAALETRVELSAGRLEQLLKVLDVDGAVRGCPAAGLDRRGVGVRRRAVRAHRRARAREQEAMRAYATLPRAGWSSCAVSSTTRRPLRAGGATCAPDRSCRSRLAGGGRPASADVRRPGVERRPQPVADRPADLASGSGAIGAGESALAGRAVGRLSDIGWGPRLRALLGPDSPTARCRTTCSVPWWRCSRRGVGRAACCRGGGPEPVAAPCWSAPWPSASPASGGCRCSPGWSGRAGTGPAGHRSNSAQRVLALHDAFTVPTASTCPAGPCSWSTTTPTPGWTMTLAARGPAPGRRGRRAAARPGAHGLRRLAV
jgi:ATP-dependent DNA helicase RecQ